MPRIIDHHVLATHDLDRTGAAFARLGFDVGAINRHPWGTQNRLVRFAKSFLELIAPVPDFAGETDALFAQRFAAFPRDRQGFAMLALASSDAAHDRDEFAAAGLGDHSPFFFEREIAGQKGPDNKVGFTLAFADAPLIPGAGFFTCQHHWPERFWTSPPRHGNGATHILGTVILAEYPSDHAEFLSHFTGQREMLATSMGVEIALGQGQVLDVLSPPAFRFRYGDAALSALAPPCLAATRIAVRDVTASERLLSQNNVAYEIIGGAIVIDPAEAAGSVIIFEQSAKTAL